MRPGSIVKLFMCIFMLPVELRAAVGWNIANPKHGNKSARPFPMIRVVIGRGTVVGHTLLLLPKLVFGWCDIYGFRTRDWKCKGSNYDRCFGRVDSGTIG